MTLLANGEDVVKSFNGSVIASPAFTGVTLSTLDHVHVYKTRAYFVEKDTQSMWYGDVGAIAGALTEFDFSGVTGIEGNLVFTSHLKGDGGDGGQDDIFVAVFAGGDMLAYSGSAPGDPTDWALVGRFRIGRPLSRLAYMAAEDDLYIITDRGYEQASKLVAYGDLYAENALFSSKIQLEVNERIQELGANIDWRIWRYPKEQMMFFQVPRSGSARAAHVRNINTGAWTDFQDLMHYSFGLFQGNFYFGSNDGVVYQFGAGAVDDNGSEIRADAQQAWTNMGSPGVNKHIHLVKPFLFATARPAISINMGANYDTIPLASFSSAGSASGAIWATASSGAIWDTAIWAGSDATFADWYSRNALGDAIGLRLAVQSGSYQTRWNQTTVEYTLGGYL